MTPFTYDVRAGYLGWSNYRSGVELYRERDGINARWEPREGPYRSHDAPTGLLLTDDIEAEDVGGEGCSVVVITLRPRSAEAKAEAAALVERIEDLLAE